MAKMQQIRLSDVVEFHPPAGMTWAWLDDDFEQGTWPEMIDQRNIGAEIDAGWNDDDEDGDDDFAVDDLACDARDEDGI